MKRLSTVLPLFLLILSCSKSPVYPRYDNMDVTSPFVTDNEIILEQGNCAGDSQSGSYVCFIKVTGDSRCPEGALCIWMGNASAEFKFTGSGSSPVTFSLNTNPQFTTDTIIGSYRFALKDLTPYPSVMRPFPPSAYKAQIEISMITR